MSYNRGFSQTSQLSSPESGNHTSSLFNRSTSLCEADRVVSELLSIRLL